MCFTKPVLELGYALFSLRDLLFYFLVAAAKQHSLKLGDQRPELVDLAGIAGHFTGQTNDNRLLCDQQGLQLLDVVGEYTVHSPVLSRVVFVY